jgi:lipid-A-disaccharide synthase
MAGAIERMKGRNPRLQFVLVKAPTVEESTIQAGLGRALASVRVLSESGYEALTHSQAAIVASGTATVEAALCETPMVVVYRVGGLSYRLGKPLVRVPFYAMVNLIAEKAVVPELIQDDMTAERVASETLRLLEDPEAAERMRRDLREVTSRLGTGGASRNAAREVLAVAGSHRESGKTRHEVVTT